MPRRLPTQVDQTLSRLLQGGYLKQTPLAYQTMLSFPPASLPPRAPRERPVEEGGAGSTSRSITDLESMASTSKRKILHSSKRVHKLMPRLGPQPIVYLADKVRRRFYEDHPWEAFRPQTLTEGQTVEERRTPPLESTELRDWGRNPSPDDVVACTVHLHKHHALPLSQAYHHTLSSYHALKAEREHATRSAVLEAKAYGATFDTTPNGQATTAVEIMRGYRKEEAELAKGAVFIKTLTGAVPDATLTAADGAQGTVRVKSASLHYSQGIRYLQLALRARDRAPAEELEPESNTGEVSQQDAQPSLDEGEKQSQPDIPDRSRVPEGVKIGANVGRSRY